MITSKITEGENRNLKSPLWRSVFVLVWALDPYIINFIFCLAAVSEL